MGTMGYQHCRTLALIGIVSLSASCRPDSSPPIPWQASFPLALEAARQQGKPVFLYMTAAWCSICRRVERETFTDPEVLSAMGRFVPVRVDIDQYPWVGQRYGIAAVPACLVLDSRGRVAGRSFGFQSPQELGVLFEVTAREGEQGE